MRFLFLFLALLLVVPVATAQKPADDADKPDEGMFGTWEYTVRPDDPMATGTFVLEQGDEQINGTINTDAARKMNDIEVTDSSLSFTFTQPGMGLIAISFMLEDGELVGTATPDGEDEPLPMVAVRPAADSDSSED